MNVQMIKTTITILVAVALATSGYAATGDTISTIPSPYRCPQGMAYDGGHLWIADRLSDMLYRVQPDDGQVIDSLPTPAYVPRGLAWDGARLWCVDAEEQLIFAVNPETEVVEKTIYCPVSRPTGLAWDGEYLWVAADRNDRIRKISTEDGTTVSSIPSPTRHSCGVAFDGTYLWVSDRYQDMVYMTTPDEGIVVVSFESNGPHPWGLAWDGTGLWEVDYETDRIAQYVIGDDDQFVRTEEKELALEFIHQVRNYGPGPVEQLDVYMAVPGNLDNQEVTAPVTFDPEPTEMIKDKWGQEVAHWRLSGMEATNFSTVSMSTQARLFDTRYFIFPEKVGALSDIPSDIREKYLVNDTKFMMDDATIQRALEVSVGDETNPYWIGRKVFNYLIENLEYELAGGWNVAPAILERGNGSCSEYTFVYISMCRAAGLPARYAGSIAVRGDDASYDEVFHRWVEIYLPNYGWIPVDPSRGDKKWPADQADSFGFLSNRLLITTVGGGGSEYLEWGYNANEQWTTRGRCKVVAENFAEWSPIAAE